MSEARQLWKNGDEAKHYAAVVRLNPRREGEPPLAYIERVAVLAGGIEPRDATRKHEGGWWDAAPKPPAQPAPATAQEVVDEYANVEVPF